MPCKLNTLERTSPSCFYSRASAPQISDRPGRLVWQAAVFTDCHFQSAHLVIRNRIFWLMEEHLHWCLQKMHLVYLFFFSNGIINCLCEEKSAQFNRRFFPTSMPYWLKTSLLSDLRDLPNSTSCRRMAVHLVFLRNAPFCSTAK